MGKRQHLKAILALPGFVLVLVPAALMMLFRDHYFGSSSSIFSCWLPILVGFTLIILGLALLVRTNIFFSRIGKGTLAPWQPTTKLVVVGIYRHVRNPMLIGVYFALLGESILFGSTSVFIWSLLFMILNHVYIVKKEEPGLVKRFGEQYLQYRRNVPRWIPRLRPWLDSRSVVDKRLRRMKSRVEKGRSVNQHPS